MVTEASPHVPDDGRWAGFRTRWWGRARTAPPAQFGRICVADPYLDSTGDLTLSDVEMQSTDGLTVAVEDISWSEVLVGTEQG